MRKTFLITFFCSLIAISGPAKATDYDFGDITAGTSAVSPALSFAGSTSFIDHFLFTLTAPVNFSSVFTNVAPTSSTLFSEFSAILSQTSPFPVSGSFSSAQIPSGGTLLFIPVPAVLTAGSWDVTVTGTSGIVGGFYVAVLTTAPVPELESYTLYGVGLVLIGTIIRRRSKAAVAPS